MHPQQRLLIANDYEMALISERTGIDKGGLMQLTDVLVTTLGEQGTRITTVEGEMLVPCVPTENVVDPTGAGDAFRGGLILGLIRKEGLERAAQIGSACAHFVIQQRGTQEYRYTMTNWRRCWSGPTADSHRIDEPGGLR